MKRRLRQLGVTLMELMIVVAIVALLAAIALPMYSEFAARGRRADAVAALEGVSLGQEKWRASNIAYSSTVMNVWAGGDGGADRSPDGYYQLSVVAATPTEFTATATPVSGRQQEGDACGTYGVNQDGPDLSGTYNADADCWRGR